MAHPVDLHVGNRLRQLRYARGVSQTELGRRVGISFQQVQKYEKGSNRLTASRLWDIADALGVPVTSFFEGLTSDEMADHDIVMPGDGEAADFLRAFRSLPGNQQQRLRELVMTMGAPH